MTAGSPLADMVSRCRRPPATAFLSLVEAASFLAFGGFIGRDDLDLLFKGELERGEENEDPRSDVEHEWDRASAAIFAKAGIGEVTLLGRAAPRFGVAAEGDHVRIPVEFFAPQSELMVWLSNAISHRSDPDRTMYQEVRVNTGEFTRAFPAPKPTRPATATERAEIRAHAERVHTETGLAPSLADLWETFPKVTRASLRSTIKELPPHLQREVGR